LGEGEAISAIDRCKRQEIEGRGRREEELKEGYRGDVDNVDERERLIGRSKFRLEEEGAYRSRSESFLFIISSCYWAR
jgi:hypothetical protein